MRPQLFSGARGSLKINGTTKAFVTDVTVTVQSNVRPVHTFGASNARSVEPLSTGVSVSIGRVYPVNTTTGDPVNTSNVAEGIEPVISLMLAAEDITVSLQDKLTGVTVADVKNCRFASGTTSVSAQQIAQSRIQLIGIYDAAGGQTPDNIGL